MAASEKPAILRESAFTLEEGFAYRAMRTGAIWMNKLFFSSLVLLGVWLLWAGLGSHEGCAPGYRLDEPRPGNFTDEPAATCSVFLTPTALYLGAMAVISFTLSIAFGALGLVVGRRAVAASPAADEVGARREGGEPAARGPREGTP